MRSGVGIETVLPWNVIGSAVLRVNAREDLDERGLARAVVADECNDFAGEDIEIDAAQRLNRTESLIDAAHRENGIRRLMLVGRHLRNESHCYSFVYRSLST